MNAEPPSGEPINIMHAPIDDLTLEQLRERHRRARRQHLEEIDRIRKELGAYWADVMQQEVDRTTRLWELIAQHKGRRTVLVDLVRDAINGP